MKVYFNTGVVNPVFRKYLWDIEKEIFILYGGTSAGKSRFVALRIIFRSLIMPDTNTLVVRKFMTTNRNSTYPELIGVINAWGVGKKFKTYKNPLSISILNGGKEVGQIRFTGLDDVEKLKSTAFSTGDNNVIHTIWVEEATELTKTDLEQLLVRQRGPTKYEKILILTFNPINKGNYIYKWFFKEKQNNDNVLIQKVTYRDNKFLDKRSIGIIESLKTRDPRFYTVYGLGNWGSMGDLIIKNWEIEECSLNESDYEDVVCGIDWGFRCPTAFVKVARKKDSDVIYILQDYKRADRTTAQLIEDLAPLIGKNIGYADSEPDRITAFQEANLAIFSVEKKGYGNKTFRVAGALFLAFARFKIHPNCKHVIDQVFTSCFKEDSDEPAEIDDDHIFDALRYATARWMRHTNVGIKGISFGW